MDIFKAIRKRRTYRGPFKDQAVPRKDLRKIVQAGMQAPSGKNAQTTSFVIVDDPALMRKISALHTMESVRTARAFIVCLTDKVPEKVYEGYSFQAEDCAAAVENMLLAITALGYGSGWIDGWLRVKGQHKNIEKILRIPSGKVARVLLPVGIPARHCSRPEKKPFEARAWFNLRPAEG